MGVNNDKDASIAIQQVINGPWTLCPDKNVGNVEWFCLTPLAFQSMITSLILFLILNINII